MSNKKTIHAIIDFITTAEKSIKNAKKLLKDVAEESGVSLDSPLDMDTSGLHSYDDGDSKIIEWVFTGEDMLASDGSKYSVPANYASKSKMVQWDKLKLTITPNGKMLYKQIAPIDRTTTTGLLTQDAGKYQVVADGKTYNVLTAAVTHFSANIGDSVSIILPTGKDASFGALDAVIPSK